MARPIRSFHERLAEQAKREALESLTLTERLLAHVLIELMETRRRRNDVEIAQRLKQVGFSQKHVAALLNTTPASLAVAQRRTSESEKADV